MQKSHSLVGKFCKFPLQDISCLKDETYSKFEILVWKWKDAGKAACLFVSTISNDLVYLVFKSWCVPL